MLWEQKLSKRNFFPLGYGKNQCLFPFYRTLPPDKPVQISPCHNDISNWLIEHHLQLNLRLNSRWSQWVLLLRTLPTLALPRSLQQSLQHQKYQLLFHSSTFILVEPLSISCLDFCNTILSHYNACLQSGHSTCSPRTLALSPSLCESMLGVSLASVSESV